MKHRWSLVKCYAGHLAFGVGINLISCQTTQSAGIILPDSITNAHEVSV
ncbi:hypothetical protein A359_07670 [secondary endosymbiont of Ctenarytaina eucalypti]|uniref:Uncharacterized protein n=1 Tax=secondary endosymbiont of Ctenarytaina eucalypti TaxID=1199245 RepID=J3VT43_9ENTR|nr:hypothetical protein A359_07670 [secondary endosymbiont of Ctenarytaina eucalypti]